MRAIISGALLAVSMSGAASAQEQPGGGFTRIHGAYVTLEYVADRGDAARPQLDFADREGRRPESSAGEAAMTVTRMRPAVTDMRRQDVPTSAAQPLR